MKRYELLLKNESFQNKLFKIVDYGLCSYTVHVNPILYKKITKLYLMENNVWKEFKRNIENPKICKTDSFLYIANNKPSMPIDNYINKFLKRSLNNKNEITLEKHFFYENLLLKIIQNTFSFCYTKKNSLWISLNHNFQNLIINCLTTIVKK